MTETNYTNRDCSIDGCSGKHKAHGYCTKHYRQLQRGGVKMAETVCAHCGNGFSPINNMAMYCSKSCKLAAWKKANPDRHKEHVSRYAPVINVSSVYVGYCLGCGKPFVSRRKKLYCGESQCSKHIANVAARIFNQVKNGNKAERECKCCGKEFKPLYGDKRSILCSARCIARWKKIAHPSSPRKRARIAGVEYEPVNRIKVFDRDGWQCQICGKVTPRRNMGTIKSNAPELDHRVPMSKGGDHLYSNVQCACRKCNGEKSNKSCIGQLPLLHIS